MKASLNRFSPPHSSIYLSMYRLRGNLFFGNIEQLWFHVREVLKSMSSLSFLVLDTAEMVGIDCHARERLAKICKVCWTEGRKEGLSNDYIYLGGRQGHGLTDSSALSHISIHPSILSCVIFYVYIRKPRP